MVPVKGKNCATTCTAYLDETSDSRNTLTMTDFVTLLFECGGRPLARYRLAFPQREYAGAFTFEEAHSIEFRRTVATARLQAPSGHDVLPPLYEAKLLWCKEGEARVTGLEIDELSQKRTAQCWNIRFGGFDKPASIETRPNA